MDSDSWLSIAVIVAAAMLLFIVAASEAAIIYISRSRARLVISTTDRRSEALHRYMEERQRTLSALNLGRNLAVVAGTAAAMHLASGADGLTWSEAALTALIALIVIGVLDGIPDVVASRNPEFWALMLTPVLRLLGLIFNPLAMVLDLPGRLVAMLPIAPAPVQEAEEQEVLLRLMEMQRGDGEEDDEREMIRGIIGLEDTTAREIMVPRIDVVALSAEATLEDALDLVVQKGFSRIPLYDGQIDNICGIVYAKDVLRHLRNNGSAPVALKEFARPPYFIPETKRVDELLAEFRQQKIHIAIVVDEYGGTAGLVTTEDILEEIVGEIEDEYDTGEPQVERISSEEAIVDARLPLDELNDLLDTSLEDEEVDTVGGFVFNQLGKMPAPGDEVRTDGIVIHVLDVQGNRIRKVRVAKVAIEPVSNGK
ncbi:MAG: hemolysin family protein [Chloroflexota bacterium]|nr:hemolysin family protein [Chloroflexota bacterium]